MVQLWREGWGLGEAGIMEGHGVQGEGGGVHGGGRGHQRLELLGLGWNL